MQTLKLQQVSDSSSSEGKGKDNLQYNNKQDLQQRVSLMLQ